VEGFKEVDRPEESAPRKFRKFLTELILEPSHV
jgi:hypothetical protein